MTLQDKYLVRDQRELSLTVLVPALNEEDNIVPTIERLEKALKKTVEDYEIIVINDGSTDLTGDVVRDYIKGRTKVRLINNEINMGLGSCYVRGIHEARKDLYVYIPGDNTWPDESFMQLFSSIGEADIVTSYASTPEVRYLFRRFVSRLYTITLNFLFGQKMHYFNGLTVYPIEDLKISKINSTGFGFQAEILLKAIYRGFSVKELKLPIDDRTGGSSKAVNWKNILNVIITILRLFFELHLQKYPTKVKAMSLSETE